MNLYIIDIKKYIQENNLINDAEINYVNLLYDVLLNFGKGKNKLYSSEDSERYTYIYKEIKSLIQYLVEKSKEYNLSSDYQYIIRWFYTQKFYDELPVDEKYIDCVIPVNKINNYGIHKYLNKYINIPDIILEVEDKIKEKCQDIYDKLYVNNDLKSSHLTVYNNKYKDTWNFKYGGLNFTITNFYYNKLKRLYIHEIGNNYYNFNKRIFNLLCRYNTLYSPGYQAGLPTQIFDLLSSELDVQHELFASPFNVSLRNYSSAYIDTDSHFGSKGNFYHIYNYLFKNGGSFEANPPFIEDHMILMALIIDYSLKTIVHPLSFVIVIPTWIDNLCYKLLKLSKFLVKDMHFERLEHFYQNGGNYKDDNYSTKNASNKTTVFILQNEQGKVKYEITDEFIKNFTFLFKC
jgi:hypothetical protein